MRAFADNDVIIETLLVYFTNVVSFTTQHRVQIEIDLTSILTSIPSPDDNYIVPFAGIIINLIKSICIVEV